MDKGGGEDDDDDDDDGTRGQRQDRLRLGVYLLIPPLLGRPRVLGGDEILPGALWTVLVTLQGQLFASNFPKMLKKKTAPSL